MFSLIFRERNHVLPLEQEKLWTKLTATACGFNDIFLTLSCSDISFPLIKDKNGKKNKIISAHDLIKYMKSKDRCLRKNAWITFHHSYYQYMNTFSKTLFNNFRNANNYAKARGFKSYADEVFFNDDEQIIVLSVNSIPVQDVTSNNLKTWILCSWSGVDG